MAHLLTHKDLELSVDFPLENYNFSRFDWTGKITDVKFKGIPLTSVEDSNRGNQNHLGKGFYNEFGIETALGFEDTKIGDWFHKIGVGLLKKEDSEYAFHKPYVIKPAKFFTKTTTNSFRIDCIAEKANGYSYELRKEIELHGQGFHIKYLLKNTGEKAINTTEYCHNFIAINNDFIGANYELHFHFSLKPKMFGETVNTDASVIIDTNKIAFCSVPSVPFFFSNLSGGADVKGAWELIHLKSKIGIRENNNFMTSKLNLWGWQHVVSPEVFFDIHITPGESVEWMRSYEVFEF